MIRFSFLICTLCIGAFNSLAQSDVLLNATNIIDTLTSPSMNGRGYTKDGDKKAANYIQNYFLNDIGIDKENVQSQNFSFDVNTFPGNLQVSINDEKLNTGADFIFQAFSQSANGIYNLQSINFKKEYKRKKKTFKIKLKENAWLCYKDSDVPKDLKKDFQKIMLQNGLFGAKGIVQITDGKLTMDMSQEVYPITWIIVKEKSLNETPEKIEIELHNNFIKNYTSQNIIASIPGTISKDSFIVISAHYDHLGQLGDSTYFPGANDNASGTAMMLSLAKRISKVPLPYTAVFIAFSGEEMGLLGSKYYTEHPSVELNKIKFLLNMDIMGTGDEGIKVVNGAVDTLNFKVLSSINDYFQLVKSVQPRGKASISDHYYFTEAGVPSFFIYTLGGIDAYHDIYDKAQTLPLTEFEDLQLLFYTFLSTIK